MLNKKAYAPIALFCFNRPKHLQQALDALAANDGAKSSDLTFFCDGPRAEKEKELTDAVRKIAHSAQGFASVTVIEREKNMGCAASVIDGLKTMFAKHESLIVIEDDLLTSPYTLSYLNKGLKLYKKNQEIFSISSFSYPPSELSFPKEYNYDMYLVPRFNCWGWGSWRDRFEKINWEVQDYEQFKKSSKLRKAFNRGGKDLSYMLDEQMLGVIDSWAIRADFARFTQGKYNIQPCLSYCTNIGLDTGTHVGLCSQAHTNDITLAKPAEQLHWLDNFSVQPQIEKAYYYSASSDFLSFRSRCTRALRPLLLRFGLWSILKKLYASLLTK